MAHAPSTYLKRIWFDSLVDTPQALEHLVGEVGASQVVIGTDYPFDMGVTAPLQQIAQANLTGAERERIRGVNALEMPSITPPASHASVRIGTQHIPRASSARKHQHVRSDRRGITTDRVGSGLFESVRSVICSNEQAG